MSTCFAWNVKEAVEAVVALLIFMDGGNVTVAGQYHNKKQCEAVVERILQEGVRGDAKFLCFDPTEKVKQ